MFAKIKRPSLFYPFVIGDEEKLASTTAALTIFGIIYAAISVLPKILTQVTLLGA